jgi:hypothetical protein
MGRVGCMRGLGASSELALKPCLAREDKGPSMYSRKPKIYSLT